MRYYALMQVGSPSIRGNSANQRVLSEESIEKESNYNNKVFKLCTLYLYLAVVLETIFCMIEVYISH